MMNTTCLLWDELKMHIHPSEVDNYSRKIGIARITRNEEVFSELSTLRLMKSTLQSNISDEIEKKNPALLTTPQRNAAIDRAVRFLDSLREKGHCVDPTNQNDSEIIKYLKFARPSRPNSTEVKSPPRDVVTPRSSRMVKDISESIAEIQGLIDDEFQKMQTEIQDIRLSMFSDCEELNEVKSITPPTTDSIEAFSKKLQTKELVLKNMSKTKGSSVTRLRDSVRLNRMWN